MPEEVGTDWSMALTNILEELDEPQFKKMLGCLKKIPKSRKNTSSSESMAQTIIEYYGEDESISEMNKIMYKIPRMDNKVQGLLRPFVEQLEEKQKGQKRKCSSDAEDQQDSPAAKKKKENGNSSEKKKRSAGFEKNNIISSSDSSDEENQADDPGSAQSDKKPEIPRWRTLIGSLNQRDMGEELSVVGKVVGKSGLRTYKTKKKEKKFFYLGVADESGCIKVMVYGKERFKEFEEGCFYSLRNVLVDVVNNKKILKVTTESTIARVPKADVPENVEKQAQRLIYSQSPVYSIEEIQSLAEKTLVSVEGKVVKINKKRGTKENLRRFQLKDKTGSIRVTLWPNDIQQLRRKSVGDFVRVTNLKTNWYKGTVYLNSTDYTRITKVQSAGVQNVTVKIEGVVKAGMKESELEVEINEQLSTFTIASGLLANVLGIRLQDDFEDKLLEKLPFSGNAEIRGNRILKLSAVASVHERFSSSLWRSVWFCPAGWGRPNRTSCSMWTAGSPSTA